MSQGKEEVVIPSASDAKEVCNRLYATQWRKNMAGVSLPETVTQNAECNHFWYRHREDLFRDGYDVPSDVYMIHPEAKFVPPKVASYLADILAEKAQKEDARESSVEDQMRSSKRSHFSS